MTTDNTNNNGGFGWVCPRCGSVWAPGHVGCGNCNNRVPMYPVYPTYPQPVYPWQPNYPWITYCVSSGNNK